MLAHANFMFVFCWSSVDIDFTYILQCYFGYFSSTGTKTNDRDDYKSMDQRIDWTDPIITPKQRTTETCAHLADAPHDKT